MTSPRLFWAPPELWADTDIRLPHEEARHALAALRLTDGEIVGVIDGVGRLARCRLRRAGEAAVGEVVEVTAQPRPRPALAVYQGAARGAKVDGVVARLAALGVAEMCVFSSGRSVVAWDARKGERLATRWAALARSAAKQSRSAWVMEVRAPLSWDDMLERLGREPVPLVLWEEATRPLREALGGGERVALVVGPEGGLAPSEAARLESAGGLLVTLGERILRTEEAGPAAAAGILWHLGRIG